MKILYTLSITIITLLLLGILIFTFSKKNENQTTVSAETTKTETLAEYKSVEQTVKNKNSNTQISTTVKTNPAKQENNNFNEPINGNPAISRNYDNVNILKQTKPLIGKAFEELSESERFNYLEEHSIKIFKDSYEKLPSISENPQTIVPFAGNFTGRLISLKGVEKDPKPYLNNNYIIDTTIKDIALIRNPNGTEHVSGYMEFYLLDPNTKVVQNKFKSIGNWSDGEGEIKTDLVTEESNIMFDNITKSNKNHVVYQLFMSKSGNSVIGNYYTKNKLNNFVRAGIIFLKRKEKS